MTTLEEQVVFRDADGRPITVVSRSSARIIDAARIDLAGPVVGGDITLSGPVKLSMSGRRSAVDLPDESAVDDVIEQLALEKRELAVLPRVFPKPPSDGSWRGAKPAVWRGVGARLRDGALGISFDIDGASEPTRLLLTSDDVATLAKLFICALHASTKSQSDSSLGKCIFDGSPIEGSSQCPPTKSSSAEDGE